MSEKATFKEGYRSYNDPLRGWILKIFRDNGAQGICYVNPAGYDFVLKDESVEGVEVIGYGVFEEKSLDPIILKVK